MGVVGQLVNTNMAQLHTTEWGPLHFIGQHQAEEAEQPTLGQALARSTINACPGLTASPTCQRRRDHIVPGQVLLRTYRGYHKKMSPAILSKEPAIHLSHIRARWFMALGGCSFCCGCKPVRPPGLGAQGTDEKKW